MADISITKEFWIPGKVTAVVKPAQNLKCNLETDWIDRAPLRVNEAHSIP